MVSPTNKFIELTDEEGWAVLFNIDHISIIYHDEENGGTCIITTDCENGEFYNVQESVRTIKAMIDSISGV